MRDGKDRAPRLLLTCEHGGNRVPARWRSLFEAHHELLESHRGFDRGALWMARAMSRRLRTPLLAAEVTRLLVDLNRSPKSRNVFSLITRELAAGEREAILARHHTPHRERVRRALAERLPVTHVAVHSFTPVLDGKVRNAGIGLLYDPRRPRERAICARWLRALREVRPDLRVRRNYPYRGDSDGLTTHLRTLFPDRRYAGIELEIRSDLAAAGDAELVDALTTSLHTALGRS